MFKLEFSPHSQKFLKKNENDIALRILNKIEQLKENPFPLDCKRVEGRSEKVFRIRIGDYRALYVVFSKEQKVFISEIDKRERVYD